MSSLLLRSDSHGGTQGPLEIPTDAYQHHRLGTAVLRLLTAHARACGIERFLADIPLENGRMFAAFRGAGLVGTTKSPGPWPLWDDLAVHHTDSAPGRKHGEHAGDDTAVAICARRCLRP